MLSKLLHPLFIGPLLPAPITCRATATRGWASVQMYALHS